VWLRRTRQNTVGAGTDRPHNITVALRKTKLKQQNAMTYILEVMAFCCLISLELSGFALLTPT